MLITNGQFLPVVYLPLNGAGRTPTGVVSVSLTTTTAVSTDITLSEGDVVYLHSDVACFVRRQASGSAAAAALTDAPLPANTIAFVRLNSGERISGILASGTGTLRIVICNTTGR